MTSTSPRAGVSQITGMIWDDKNANGVREAGEDGAPFLRVFLDDDRDGVADPGEPASYKTNITGYYSLPIPSRYQAAGGNLPPLVLERAAGADCTAPATCVIEGLRSKTHDVVRVDHGVARPVVIFVHGYGGSRISCPGKYMWFNAGRLGPDLMNMRLGEDGEPLRESRRRHHVLAERGPGRACCSTWPAPTSTATRRSTSRTSPGPAATTTTCGTGARTRRRRSPASTRWSTRRASRTASSRSCSSATRWVAS